jgi:polysaccharide pyruvyl transferase WcaK-like protein
MGWTWPPLVAADRKSAFRHQGSDVRVGVNLMAVPQDYRGAHGRPEGEDKWSREVREAFEVYLEAMRALVVHVARTGHRVVLFSSETQHDPPLQRRFRDALNEEFPELAERVELVPQRESAADVLDIIAGLDIVVATRYHTALLSLGLGRPTIGVAYSRKTADLFRAVEDAGPVFELDQVAGTQLIDAVAGACISTGQADDASLHRRQLIRDSVVRQFDHLFGPVESRTPSSTSNELAQGANPAP